jgi:tripartite-type tricarboxylate transporter receptor subunit TctC
MTDKRWFVSFTAGGANDTIARIIGQYLSDHLGQQFIIEDRVGAGGNVGMQALSSAPDGYTIAFNAISATRSFRSISSAIVSPPLARCG